MALSEAQSIKLFNITREYLAQLAWQSPHENEREPNYTARALAPGIQEQVQLLNHSGLVVRSDGVLTPQAVQFDKAQHYPDMAINFHHDRIGAIEVKFFDDSLRGQAYLTAIGQGVMYSSLGYSWSIIVLVAKTPTANIDQGYIDALNSNLASSHVFLTKLVKSTTN